MLIGNNLIKTVVTFRFERHTSQVQVNLLVNLLSHCYHIMTIITNLKAFCSPLFFYTCKVSNVNQLSSLFSCKHE